MSLKKILHYVGKVTYRRGKQFYEDDKILSYFEEQGAVTATIRGRGSQEFKVTLSISPDEEINASSCTCPLWNRCEHIAAVLIHHYTLNNQLLLETPAGKGGKNLYTIEYNDPVKPAFRRLVEDLEEEKYPPPEAEDPRWWRLFFRLRLYRNMDESGWFLSPVLRYIKKDGSLGSVYNYTGKKRIQKVNEVESSLLYRLLEEEGKKAPLERFMEDLIRNPGLPLILAAGHSNYPVALHPLEKGILKFDLDSIQGSTVYFRPYWEFFYNKESVVSTYASRYDTLKYGDILFIIFQDGLILYSRGNKELGDFYKHFMNTTELMNPSDIKFLKKYLVSHFSGDLELEFDVETIKVIRENPRAVIELKENIFRDLHLKLIFQYRHKECTGYNQNQLLILEKENNQTLAIRRNMAMESRTLRYLEDLLVEEIPQGEMENFVNCKINMKQSHFLARYGALLIENGFILKVGRNRRISKNAGHLSLVLNSGVDWFDLKARFFDKEMKEQELHLDPEDMASGIIQAGEEFILLSTEDRELLDRLQQEGLSRQGNLRFSALDFDLMEELASRVEDTEGRLKKYREIYLKLKQVSEIPLAELPFNLKCNLRHYQITGYNWLLYLYENNINGCLADDMGLGKTIQTLALLQRLKESGSLGPSLLVLPVTLIANWESELETFTTGINYLKHAGPDRVQDEKFITSYDLIIVSYHTLRNDIELFNKVDFQYIILDESQNIKNAFSKTFDAIRSLKAAHRLSLTGTPVENNTLELWSQMEFLNPGLLGSISEFKERFALPIEEQGDQEAAGRLRRLIYPFILRRRKEEVIQDLPEKEIIFCYSEMGVSQRNAYNLVKNNYRERITDLIRQKGLGRSRIEIFDAILRLRQMALFPELVSEEFKDLSSSKFDLLKDMLMEILEENHKVLIFSQFVKVLKKIRLFLEEQNLTYCYIDGSSRNRKEEINRFQEEENTRLFLLSLKAGGTGINLTAADYVILFDPWWNPAVESQAIDRTHRIGQTRKVLGYKMIVKNTIEEKIVRLQERKKELVSKIIAEDKNVFKSLSEEDIMDLFE